MRKRLFSILLAQCMVLSLVPTTAFAEDSTEETAVCTCEMACTEETMNAECPICGAEGAPLTDCAQVNVQDDTNNEQQTANAENGFEYTVTGDEATITGYTGSAKNIVIPSELGGKPVTAIADKAFYEYKTLNIYIPKTIKTIGEDAFPIGSDETRFICYEGTENEWANIAVQKGNGGLDPEHAGVNPWFRLYECNLSGDMVYQASDDAATLVRYFGSDSKVDIPAELGGKPVTSIGVYAFWNCRSLTKVTIPEGVTSIKDSTFRYCISLPEVNIPKSVETIGDEAFETCDSLTEVTIPEGVTSIGVCAFQFCNSLPEVTIPEGVTSIGDGAFQSCRSLTEVTISEGVTSIGETTFAGCRSLTEVTIPKSVTSIGGCAFQSCSSLTKATIPEGVTSIRGSVFEGCSSLREVTIPKSVTSIESHAFYNCGALATVYYGGTQEDWDALKKNISEYNTPLLNANIICAIQESNGFAYTVTGDEATITGYTGSAENIVIPSELGGKPVTAIADKAFEGYKNIVNIYIPKTIKAIGEDAFQNATSNLIRFICYEGTENEWANIAIQKGNEELNPREFDDVAWFRLYECNLSGDMVYQASDDAATLVRYFGADSKVDIPAELGGKPVTEIGEWAFAYYSSLTEVTIPEGVTSIRTFAFRSCSSLTKAIIPEGVTSIGESAFQSCGSLTEVTIPKSVTSIESFAFCDCGALATVYYGGTQEDWDALKKNIGEDNDPLLNANVIYKGADYTKVDEAIAKANALNKDDYKDFSAVEAAVNAVVRDKNITEQSEVDAMAKAIEDAIAALQYKDADYTKVDEAIAKANTLNKDDYKDFSGVEAAINAVVRDKNITEQSEVDAMAKAIEDAIAALQYKGADYTKVDEAIAKANALNKDDYKDFSGVEAAVNAVVRGKNITEQSEVDAMAKAIEDAIAALQYKGADYTKVDEAIAKANALNKDDYKDFSGVEAAVNAVVRDKNITEQSEVDAMAKAIEDAIAALQYKGADYTKVDEAIAKANALNKDNYKDFSAVEAAVNAVVRDKNITEQSEVDAMAKAIEDAIAALQYKDADYTKVDDAIAKANALNKDDYKDFSGVEAAINAVVRGKNITEQSEVDAMAKAIEDAIAALQYKEKPKICKGGKEVKISNGAHEMRIHGKSYGTFTFAWVNDKAGWSIQNADGKYLSFDNGKLVLRDTAYVWKYDAKFYTTTEEKTRSGWGWWGRPSTKVTNWYLVGDGTDLSISKSDTNADVKLYDAMESTEHSFGKWTPAEDGKHTRTCTICGATETGDCTYENGACTVCGALDPDNASVSVSATVTKRTSGGGGWWWWNRPTTTTWEARITATGTGVDIDKVEYSDDGKHYLTGTSFTSDTEITKFYIRVTDSKGNVTNWLYENGNVTQK